eukprot:1158592-Pelagomonas_calceolata.AAC.5
MSAGCLRSWVPRTSSWDNSLHHHLLCSLMSTSWSFKSAWTARMPCPSRRSVVGEKDNNLSNLFIHTCCTEVTAVTSLQQCT